MYKAYTITMIANMTDEEVKMANLYIDSLEDAIENLASFSVDHDDLFDVQLVDLREKVKDCRKQLI